MENIEIREGEEYIKLGQALKKAGIAGSGVEAKDMISEGKVSVNDVVETRRGRKLYRNDVIEVNGQEYLCI